MAGSAEGHSIGERLARLRADYASGVLPSRAFVEQLYALLMGREVDPASMDFYLAEPTLDPLAASLIASDEFQARWHGAPGFYRRVPAAGGHRRVLLFGAYGNGNLGDSIQPAALARAIAAIRPDIELWACSQLGAPFEFPMDRVLPPALLGNRQTLESFDLLLIGGGGLLAHPHDPLVDPYWQANLPCPVALFGIGAREPAVLLSEPLIAAATVASGRDRTSVALLAARRADVVPLVGDPVLCDATLERAARATRAEGSLLWILKWEDIAAHEPLLAQIDLCRDRICFLEPPRDFALVERWPSAQPIFRLAELIDLIDASDGVVSMRFHGTILGIQRGLPVFAVGEDKAGELLERLGCGDAYQPHGEGFARAGSLRAVPRAALHAERGSFLQALGGLLGTYC